MGLRSSNDSGSSYLPSALAEAMVKAGGATIADQNSRVKSIKLIASTHADRVGEAEGRWGAVRFYRREMLPESSARIWQHSPRATDYE